VLLPERAYPVALIVHPDAEARASIVRNLRDAGFQAVGADSFDVAKHLIGLEPVDVLVTEARLGDFHGLHLVLLARYVNPTVFAAVLASTHDEVLQRDVEGAGATLFVGDRADSIVACIASRRTTLPRAAGDAWQ
jgi:DNA-binding response OmpR family regulator